MKVAVCGPEEDMVSVEGVIMILLSMMLTEEVAFLPVESVAVTVTVPVVVLATNTAVAELMVAKEVSLTAQVTPPTAPRCKNCWVPPLTTWALVGVKEKLAGVDGARGAFSSFLLVQPREINAIRIKTHLTEIFGIILFIYVFLE